MELSSKVKKYEADITKYKVVIDAEEKFLKSVWILLLRRSKILIQAHLILANMAR